MKSTMSFLLPALVASLAAASPLSQQAQAQMITKQALDVVPAGWQLKAAAPADLKINMHIRLKEQNLDQLQQRVLQISDPDHAEYGKHMSKAEIEALTAPTKQDVDAVTEWLKSHGVEAGKVSGGFMPVSVTAAQASNMIAADYGVFYNAEKDQYTVRTTRYSLPRSVHESIAMIQPTTLFTDLGMSNKNSFKISPKNKSNKSNKIAARSKIAVCDDEGTTPACLRENYNIKGYTPQDGKTTFSISGFLGEVPNTDDLSQFLEKYTNISSDATYDVVTINGGPNDNSGGGEANLDVQYGVSLTHPIKTDFYSTGGKPPFKPDEGSPDNTNEPYLEWINYLVDLDQPPLTVSNSYGDDEQTVPKDYADAVCTQFMKLAAKGVSVLIASGDDGASGIDGSCTSNDGSGKHYLPSFPPTCPWVTSVGGTSGYGTSEVAELDSGGGFSNYYGIPDYQSAQVKAYVKSLGSKLQGQYNKSGRAYPDLSAAYSGYSIFQHGSEQTTGGTSASTPVVSSIIALLNDYLVSQGKSPLGFLNPFLYKKGASGLRDITGGSSHGCGQNAFPAQKGWDAATGLGVPDFGKLKNLV